MTELSLHSSGKKNHLKFLKKEYKSAVKNIKEENGADIKKTNIRSLKRIFKVEKKGTDHNLY